VETDVKKLHLFEAYGIELEYMLVDCESLEVCPAVDQLLSAAVGHLATDFEDGDIAWSNELALHVIELKTNGPVASLNGLASRFQESIHHANSLASNWGACLMPTAMHPWMNPKTDLKLWPHDYNEIYQAYHQIFDCYGHGWANLQSMHINLPFASDDEFGRLHAATRLMLAIAPAIAASSPIADGRITGFLDYRMEVYRHNSHLIPSIAGQVIPEPVFTQEDYDREIFQVIKRDILPWDRDGILQHSFLNSRGAIARFDRGAIEIRVIDIQECPAVDIAIAAMVTQAIRMLTREEWIPYSCQRGLKTEALSELFINVIRDADEAVIRDASLLAALGMKSKCVSVGEVWSSLLERVSSDTGQGALSTSDAQIIRRILDHGPLARRILRALAGDMRRLPEVYRQLCVCLTESKQFGV